MSESTNHAGPESSQVAVRQLSRKLALAILLQPDSDEERARKLAEDIVGVATLALHRLVVDPDGRPRPCAARRDADRRYACLRSRERSEHASGSISCVGT